MVEISTTYTFTEEERQPMAKPVMNRPISTIVVLIANETQSQPTAHSRPERQRNHRWPSQSQTLPVIKDPANAPIQTMEIIQETSSSLFLSRNICSGLVVVEFFKMRLISDSTTCSRCIDEMAGDVQVSTVPMQKAPSKAVNAAKNCTLDA